MTIDYARARTLEMLYFDVFVERGRRHAGDTITVVPRIVDAYPKDDRMDFVVKRTEFRRGYGLVATAETLALARAVMA